MATTADGHTIIKKIKLGSGTYNVLNNPDPVRGGLMFDGAGPRSGPYDSMDDVHNAVGQLNTNLGYRRGGIVAAGARSKARLDRVKRSKS